MSGSGDECQDGVRWLSDAEQASWRAILRGTILLAQALDAALNDAGLQRSEYEIISMLSESSTTAVRARLRRPSAAGFLSAHTRGGGIPSPGGRLTGRSSA